MATVSAWAPVGGAEKYGLTSDGPRTNAHSELHAVSSPAEGAYHAVQPFHPSNPLLAFGIVAAVTFGLMAFSTSVRVGGTKAALSVGDTK